MQSTTLRLCVHMPHGDSGLCRHGFQCVVQAELILHIATWGRNQDDLNQKLEATVMRSRFP